LEFKTENSEFKTENSEFKASNLEFKTSNLEFKTGINDCPTYPFPNPVVIFTITKENKGYKPT
jgi:hypothetical protein